MKFILITISLILFSTALNADMSLATQMVQKHEGFRSKPYIDATHFSVGYGTNLMDGISKEEALVLLEFRLFKLERKLIKLPWYNKLTPLRKAIILDLGYNVGLNGLKQFTGMIWCLKNNYWNAASNHMKKSKWCSQVKTRCTDLSLKMRSN